MHNVNHVLASLDVKMCQLFSKYQYVQQYVYLQGDRCKSFDIQTSVIL